MTVSPNPPPLAPLSGLLTAQVRYAARLAHGLDPRLELGALRAVTTTGARCLTARVAVDPGGDLRLHGGVGPDRERASTGPAPAVPLTAPGASADTATDACLAKLHALPGVAWGALVRADRTVLGSVGHPVAGTLPDVAVRAWGILTGLEQHRDDCVWLVHDQRTVAVAPVGGACVVLCLGTHDVDAVLATVASVRFTLAAVDLTAATPLEAPYRPPVSHDLTDEFGGVEDVEWEEWVTHDVPLTGARFAGAAGSVTRERRHRQGRWFRRAQAS